MSLPLRQVTGPRLTRNVDRTFIAPSSVWPKTGSVTVSSVAQVPSSNRTNGGVPAGVMSIAAITWSTSARAPASSAASTAILIVIFDKRDCSVTLPLVCSRGPRSAVRP